MKTRHNVTLLVVLLVGLGQAKLQAQTHVDPNLYPEASIDTYATDAQGVLPQEASLPGHTRPTYDNTQDALMVIHPVALALDTAEASPQPSTPEGQPRVLEKIYDRVDNAYFVAEGEPLTRILEVAWSKRITGYVEGALAYYQVAVERYPHSAEAHSALAGYYYELGRFDEAIDAYQQAYAVATTPEQRAEAEYFYRRIAKERLWGTQAVTFFDQGYQQFQVQAYYAAGNAFAQVLQLAPNWLEAQHWYGRSLIELGELDKATVHITFVADNAPADSELYRSADWLLSTVLARE